MGLLNTYIYTAKETFEVEDTFDGFVRAGDILILEFAKELPDDVLSADDASTAIDAKLANGTVTSLYPREVNRYLEQVTPVYSVPHSH